VITLGDAATSVTTLDGLVAAAGSLTVNAVALTNNNSLIWDGSAETNGTFSITGGAGADTIIGGAGNDTINAGAGDDTIVSGTGNDSLGGGSGNNVFILGTN
jgi:hypothetical protein